MAANNLKICFCIIQAKIKYFIYTQICKPTHIPNFNDILLG